MWLYGYIALAGNLACTARGLSCTFQTPRICCTSQTPCICCMSIQSISYSRDMAQGRPPWDCERLSLCIQPVQRGPRLRNLHAAWGVWGHGIGYDFG